MAPRPTPANPVVLKHIREQGGYHVLRSTMCIEACIGDDVLYEFIYAQLAKWSLL
ncbi:hypothetical protein ALC53_01510 [Atta colombica]|uniref:Uncharacterized protein n=1 Tax=Atta colombica TaxID=520822 RepID=A0A195BUL7_9HYME|nr:hypothetical protein ALC53_01510 [Atta colombica]